VTVLNKIDKLVPSLGQDQTRKDGNYKQLLGDAIGPLNELLASYPNAVAVSAAYSWGFSELLAKIQLVLDDRLAQVKLRLPYSEGELLALFHEKGTITKRRYTKDGAMIAGRVPRKLLNRFARYAVQS
jgi:GTP-binding protein HflX